MFSYSLYVVCCLYVTFLLPPERATKAGPCHLFVCLFVCLSVLGKFSNFFLQYKAAAVRAVISIRYGSKEGVQGSLLVPQYILP